MRTASVLRIGVAVLLGVTAAASASHIPSTAQQKTFAPSSSPSSAEIAEGVKANLANNPEAALAHFRRALELARAEADRMAEGRALRGVGHTLLRLGRIPEAKTELESAGRVLEDLQAKGHLAPTLWDLGVAYFRLDDDPSALKHYARALALFEELGDVRSQADLYHSMSLSASSVTDGIAFLEKGLPLAQQIGDARLLGAFFHSWSDKLFQQGHYGEAMGKIDLAIDHFESRGDAGEHGLALALTSLGRLYRVHGQHERALESYQHAYRIQEQRKDREGMIQSLNAMGVASGHLNRTREEGIYLERAVALARSGGGERLLGLAMSSLGNYLIRTGETARGVALLEELITRGTPLTYPLVSLANGYIALGQYARAVEAVDRAVAAARAGGFEDLLYHAFATRSRAHDRQGRAAEALADAQEAVALIERGRAGAVPTDSMKGGYAGEYDWVFSMNIELLHRLGRHREALDVAERARARAFADLLATRSHPTASADSRLAKPVAQAAAASEPVTEVTTWRTAEAGISVDRTRAGDLRSAASVDPLTSTELAALAKRLDSTILTYWVTADATFVWVVNGSGDVNSLRVDAGETKLRELVGRARSVKPSQSSRSGEADASSGSALEDTEWVRLPRLRGAGLLSLGDTAVLASRSLYGLLVQPIERFLPPRGGLLTIVPHGPLFMLSFTALQNASGQYLLERYAMHYAPAGIVLHLTDRQKPAAPSRRPAYLLVGDPVALPARGNGKPLPRLPGTAIEIKEIARAIPRATVTTLVGSQSTEEAVRRAASGPTVIHFATHGVVNAAEPLDSFLALDTGLPRRDTHRERRSVVPIVTQHDGRLTVREIYDLRLAADLVVLSACETALGRISGDGVAGLARAFVYAGTPSVVATLWDIADEPAARLMPEFYRTLRTQSDTARALRSAQLKLLGDLRSGRVRVETASGPVVLREHPILWAGFMLFGEH